MKNLLISLVSSVLVSRNVFNLDTWEVSVGKTPWFRMISRPNSEQMELQQTGFDCSNIKSPNDYLVCHDSDLAALSRKTLALIDEINDDPAIDSSAVAARMDKPGLKEDSTCKDKECLTAWYVRVIGYLQRVEQTHNATPDK